MESAASAQDRVHNASSLPLVGQCFTGAPAADDMPAGFMCAGDESHHVIDKLKHKFQSLDTDTQSLAADVKYLDNAFECFDQHVCDQIDELTLRVSELEKDKQNQRQEITDLNKRLENAESAARHSAMRMDWLLTEWLTHTTDRPEPPVQSRPTVQCKSTGCTFGKHPHGASWGFPDHCCLDCQNKNKTCYSGRNHGPRCCGGTLAFWGV